METDTGEDDDNKEKAAEEEIYPPSKPQRVRPLPKVKGVELVNMSVEVLPDLQGQRDREQRATVGALRLTRRTATGRSPTREEETEERKETREPEDSKRSEET